MELLSPVFYIYLLLILLAFVVSNVVCLLFIIKCIRVMFSEKAMQSIIRHPVLHVLWMLAAMVCANFAINGYQEIWNIVRRRLAG